MATRSKPGNKPSALCEELIEALLDPRLVEALGKALAPVISQPVDDAVAPLVKQIQELKAENARLAMRCVAGIHFANVPLLEHGVNEALASPLVYFKC